MAFGKQQEEAVRNNLGDGSGTNPIFRDAGIASGSGSHGVVSSQDGNLCGKPATPSAKRIESSASKELGNRTNLHHVVFGSDKDRAHVEEATPEGEDNSSFYEEDSFVVGGKGLLLEELRTINDRNGWEQHSHISGTPIVDLQDVPIIEEPEVEPPFKNSPNKPNPTNK